MSWIWIIGSVICGWSLLTIMGGERNRRLGEIIYQIEQARAEEEERKKELAAAKKRG